MTKPFSPRELVLRIRKLLGGRMAEDEPAAQLRLGEIEIDVPRHLVQVGGPPDRPDRHGVPAAGAPRPPPRPRAVARPAAAGRLGV